MRILLDADGLLLDFITPALRIVRELGGPDLRHDDVTDYDLGQLVPEPKRALFWRLCGARGFCSSILPYPLTWARLLATSRMDGVSSISIVTAPMRDSLTWEEERRQQLRQYFPFLDHALVHVRHDKHAVPGDLFLDDSPDHVSRWQAANPQGLGLIWDRNYNRHAQGPRVHGWSALHELVTRRALEAAAAT